MPKHLLIRGLAAATLSFALLAAACGGDDAKTDEAATTTAGGDTGTAATAGPGITPTRTSPTRAVATAVPADGAALMVANPAAKVQYVPTADQFRALTKTTIKGKEGVSLATLASSAGITGATLATIDGTVAASSSFGAIRYNVADIGSTTIFVMDDRGHISMASDTIPEAEWLTLVTSIVLE